MKLLPLVGEKREELYLFLKSRIWNRYKALKDD